MKIFITNSPTKPKTIVKLAVKDLGQIARGFRIYRKTQLAQIINLRKKFLMILLRKILLKRIRIMKNIKEMFLISIRNINKMLK